MGPLELFELVKREEELGTIKSVRHYATFNGSNVVVVEYFVEYEREVWYGTASVKLVYADNPAIALAGYYKWTRVRGGKTLGSGTRRNPSRDAPRAAGFAQALRRARLGSRASCEKVAGGCM